MLYPSLSPVVSKAEMSGYVALEGRGFTHSPLYAQQEHNDGAIILAPEFYKEFDDGSQAVFSPFYIKDAKDEERSHGDIRELYFLKVFETSELSIGVKKIFWGITESRHVVDIINQTDLVTSFDGEDKLGQPMVHYSKILSDVREFGVLDFFIMPYFRERTFPGIEGRLRGPLVVDTDHPLYESKKEEDHIDYAVRYTNTFGDVDFSVSHFDGTNRDPDFIPLMTPAGPATMMLTPYYSQINQTGITGQLLIGEWILKLEAIHRNGSNLSYESVTTGFEYTFTSILETKMDLGTLLEYHYDSRGFDSPSPFEDDVMGGFRLAVNDLGSTEILAGIVQSLEHSTKYYFIEASRRLTNNIKINFEGRSFSDQPKYDQLYFLSGDDHLLLEVAYYF